ncbi:MAG TPA: hypothetical protein VE262_06610 [Blastocatellia bacterium]|nr:hypothetical protein [Blastocatellia bacterium]
MKITKKAFREELNRQDAEQQANGGSKHKNYQYHQLRRLYGDYLYFQDREKFNVNFEEWKVEQLSKQS